MPDLKDELQRLAEDFACQARPLPLTDLIRQGERGHRRTILPWPPGGARARGLATPVGPRRPWPRWVAPVAAAAAVSAVVAGAALVSGAIHGPGPAGSTAATLYVGYANSFNTDETVVPIRTRTNTAGKPIHVVSTGTMAITPDGKTLYIASDNTVIPVSTASETPGRPIQIQGGAPYEVVINPDGKTVYVISSLSDSITPVSTATNTPGKPFHLSFGLLPPPIAFSPDGKTAYVATSEGTVTPVNTATNRPGKAIRVFAPSVAMVGPLDPQDIAGQPLNRIAVTPDGKTVYALGVDTLPGVGSYTAVVPISTATNTPGKPIPIGNSADIAITPDGKTVYVAGSNAGTVIPINTVTNRPGKPIRVGIVPFEIAVTPDGKTVYVSSFLGPGTVVPISTATNTPGQPIPANLGNESLIAIAPDGKTVYALDGNVILPISTATNTPGKPIRVRIPSIGTAGIAIAP